MAEIEDFRVTGPDSGPYALTAGPDGALWYTQIHGSGIGRRTLGGEHTDHRLEPDCGPAIITPGPDGALWFTRSRDDRIGRIITEGAIDRFPLPTPGSSPFGIAQGPDGALWFTELAGDRIGRITTGGTITEYDLPVGGAFPSAITAGADGALWCLVGGAGDRSAGPHRHIMISGIADGKGGPGPRRGVRRTGGGRPGTRRWPGIL